MKSNKDSILNLNKETSIKANNNIYKEEVNLDTFSSKLDISSFDKSEIKEKKENSNKSESFSQDTPSYYRKDKENFKKKQLVADQIDINKNNDSKSSLSKTISKKSKKSNESESFIDNKSQHTNSFVNSIDLDEIENTSDNDKKYYRPIDYEYYDIFSFARHNKFIEIETLLFKGIDPDSRDMNGNTILIVGAQNGNKRIIKLALRFGAQINNFNYLGNTALHFATQYQYYDLVDYLIKKGADPLIKNYRGLQAYQGVWKKE